MGQGRCIITTVSDSHLGSDGCHRQSLFNRCFPRTLQDPPRLLTQDEYARIFKFWSPHTNAFQILLLRLYITGIPNNPNTPRTSPTIVTASRAILDVNERFKGWECFAVRVGCSCSSGETTRRRLRQALPDSSRSRTLLALQPFIFKGHQR
jgi:hypothetical protein